MKRIRVGVIGGGASGMMAAITAAHRGAEVTILEGGERVGKKLLSTGNGKCNLGNLEMSEQYFYGSTPEWLRSALERFPTEETVRFFGKLGMLVKNKGGYLYPASEQASTVLDVLRQEVKALGIRVVTAYKVNEIAPSQNGGQIRVSDGKTNYSFDRVILACGGKAAPKTGSDGSGYRLARRLGHKIVPTVPALVQLKCREDYLKAVAGVRCVGEVKALYEGKCVAGERGEIQFTEYGISGIPVFQLSRTVNYILEEQQEVDVILDLFPDYDEEAYRQLQADRAHLKTGRTVEEFFTGLLNKKLMMLFVKLSGLKQQEQAERADEKALSAVYHLCRHWELHVNGHKSYDNAQVCAGGVDTAEVTAEMESKIVPKVYFAGELLDVDGRCGGYNLHWAWCSGYLAGCAAAEEK